MSIGKRIKERRTRLGLSQVELATAVNINQVTISKYENGKTKDPRMSILFLIAQVLETTPEHLLYGTKHKHVNDPVGGVRKLLELCRGLPPSAIKKLIATARELRN